MSELERARAHLRDCQQGLMIERNNRWHSGRLLPVYENHVLAALSWVWEEQENAAIAEMVEVEISWKARPIGNGLYMVKIS